MPAVMPALPLRTDDHLPQEHLPLDQPLHLGGDNAAALRPTDPQRRYLERGVNEPGGKLPLFDRDGRAVPRKTVEACVAHGWARPWFDNPLKPDWLVCRLTEAGWRAIGREPPKA